MTMFNRSWKRHRDDPDPHSSFPARLPYAHEPPAKRPRIASHIDMNLIWARIAVRNLCLSNVGAAPIFRIDETIAYLHAVENQRQLRSAAEDRAIRAVLDLVEQSVGLLRDVEKEMLEMRQEQARERQVWLRERQEQAREREERRKEREDLAAFRKECATLHAKVAQLELDAQQRRLPELERQLKDCLLTVEDDDELELFREKYPRMEATVHLQPAAKRP